VTGCSHLFGGPQALLEDLLERLKKSGYGARAALAPAPGAAWALARFGENSPSPCITTPGDLPALLAPLPVAALRIDGASAEGLERIGLRRIGDLLELPRAPLSARFGRDVARRLDQALGHVKEPISPAKPGQRHLTRMVLAEPIGRVEDARAGTHQLIGKLCAQLTEARLGARRLEAVFYRVDNSQARLAIGTSRPAKDETHLARLFEDKMENLDPGFGIEVITLEATRTDVMNPVQEEMDPNRQTEEAEDAAQLLDRLIGRFGAANVARLAPQASHLPERAMRRVSALKAGKGN
ncbi:MAG: DNA polymerase Y family protein, partial [Rhodospirillales bacterium]|nr:DNA polymerase Y family protein [Rhodospirillales bacterium]